MVSVEFFRKRRPPLLKAGLLCATLITPVAALANPSEEAGSGQSISQESVTKSKDNVTKLDADSATQVAMATPAATALSTTESPAATPSASTSTKPNTKQPKTAISSTESAATATKTTETKSSTEQFKAGVSSAELLATITTIVETKPKPTAKLSKVDYLSQHIQRTYKIPEQNATRIVQEAIKSGDRHQLAPELILAIIAVESTFRERAVSRVGARGLMQVMPGVHRNKVRDIGGTRALFDPAKNIHTGAQILVDYLNNHSGDLRRALLNYNGSLGSRSSYADRVMRIYQDFQRVTIEG